MDYDDFYGFRPYVSVGARRAQAARALAALKKKGRTISPVVIDGRKIARTFWGEAWCDNLERYSDFANRLPRGRAYARNGSVVDLQVGPGRVTALVSGSNLYDVSVTVEPVPRTRWAALCRDCSSAIDSLVELLQGRFSKSVMTRLCQDATGLFPSPKEIRFVCSCPDWASMCKHVSAVLYGIGARLDAQPELLFTLRNVDHQDLIAKAGSSLPTARRTAGAKVLADDDLSDMFGIEIAPDSPKPATDKRPAAARKTSAKPKTTERPAIARATSAKAKGSPAKSPSGTRSARAKAPAAEANMTALAESKALPGKAKAALLEHANTPAAKRPSGKAGLTPATRRAVAERMRQYWAARRAPAAKRKS